MARRRPASASTVLGGSPRLNVLLAVNVLCALVIRLPWRRRQAGFVLTHVGILVLLAGCLATRQWGIEAQLSVYEGHASHLADEDSYHFELLCRRDDPRPVCLRAVQLERLRQHVTLPLVLGVPQPGNRFRSRRHCAGSARLPKRAATDCPRAADGRWEVRGVQIGGVLRGAAAGRPAARGRGSRSPRNDYPAAGRGGPRLPGLFAPVPAKAGPGHGHGVALFQPGRLSSDSATRRRSCKRRRCCGRTC